MLKKSFIILILVFLSFIPTSGAANHWIHLKNAPNYSLLQSEVHASTLQLLGEIIVLPAGTYDAAAANSMITRIGHLPVSLLEKVCQKNIKVNLVNGKLTEHVAAQSLAGKTPRGYENTGLTWDDLPGVGGSKQVIVKIGYSEQGSGHGSVNLELHELAHSIDHYVYGDIRDWGEFLTIWKAEKEALFPKNPYFFNYPEEYFAEIFAMYYLNKETRETLQTTAPQSFAFIKKL